MQGNSGVKHDNKEQLSEANHFFPLEIIAKS